MTASKPMKNKSKHNNPKAISKSATKNPLLVEVKQPKSSLNDVTLTTLVTPEKERKETLDDTVIPLLTADTPKVSNNNTPSSTSTTDLSSCLGKRSSEIKKPFAAHLDVDALIGYKNKSI